MEEAGRENSLIRETISYSDSGSGPESSVNTDLQLESFAGPKFKLAISGKLIYGLEGSG